MEACFVTFLLSGMLSSWTDGFILAGSIFAIRFYNRSLSHRLRNWDTLVSRLPALLRFTGGIGLAYLLARLIVSAMWQRTTTFRPVLISIVLSLGAMTLLIPESREQDTSASGD